MALMLDAALRIALVIATAFLFGIILLAYLRVKTTKLLFISAGFAVFFLHSLLYMPQIMFQSIKIQLTDNTHIAFNLLALVLITIGIISENQ